MPEQGLMVFSRADNSVSWVGDINRMISQRKRGGGTVAFQNQILWQGLSKTDLLLAPPGMFGNLTASVE